MVFVSFALDRKSKLASIVDIRALGLAFESEDTISDQLESIANMVEKAIKGLSGEDRDDDETVEKLVARIVKKATQSIWDRRPLVETIILRP